MWAPAYNSPILNDTNIAVGDTIRIDVNMTNSPPLVSFGIQVVYDFSVLSLKPLDLTGTVFGEIGGNVIPTPIPPRVRLDGFCIGCIWPGGNGTLVHLDFQVQKEGVSPLALYETLFGQPGVGGFAHEIVDGYFTNTEKLGPVADFTFTPAQPMQGDEVTFDASATSDPDCLDPCTQPGIQFYDWFFGSTDPTSFTVSGPTIKHVMGGEQTPKGGTFWVRLIATDFEGNQGIKIFKVNVAPQSVHDVRIFRLSVEPSAVMPGQKVRVQIVVDNPGTFSEVFSLTLSMSQSVLNTWQAQSLAVRDSLSFQFDIDTTGLGPGTYEVVAEIVVAQDDVPDNSRASQFFVIRTQQASLFPFLVIGSGVVGATAGGLILVKRLRSRSTSQLEHPSA